MQRLRIDAISAGRTGTGTLMVLGERLIKAMVLIIAVLATLGILGFNLTTVLAGVGIGGIAIAFAAQKTLENLFGGISSSAMKSSASVTAAASAIGSELSRTSACVRPAFAPSSAPCCPSPTARSPP